MSEKGGGEGEPLNSPGTSPPNHRVAEPRAGSASNSPTARAAMPVKHKLYLQMQQQMQLQQKQEQQLAQDAEGAPRKPAAAESAGSDAAAPPSLNSPNPNPQSEGSAPPSDAPQPLTRSTTASHSEFQASSRSPSASESELSALSDAESVPTPRASSSRGASAGDVIDMAELDPELYGLRRSGRARQPVPRLSNEPSSPPSVRRRKKPGQKRSSDARAAPRRRTASAADSDSDASWGSVSGPARKRRQVGRRSADGPAGGDEDDGDEDMSDGDSDYGGSSRRKQTGGSRRPARGRRGGAGAKRQTASTSSSISSLTDALRFSTRSRGVKNYSEEQFDAHWVEDGGLDEEELAEWDAQEARQRKREPNGDFMYNVDASGPAVGAICDYRPRSDSTADVTGDEAPEDLEYLVKWRGRSLWHCSWEPLETLTALPGFKKVLNYYAEAVAPRLRLLQEPADAPGRRETLEELDLQRQEAQALLAGRRRVERVLAAQEDAVLCKWEDVPYRDCTWEAVETDDATLRTAVDAFRDRQASGQLPHHGRSYARDRPKVRPLVSPSDWAWVPAGRTLHAYQKLGVNWLVHMWCQQMNGILADEMGLGKTIQTISFLNYLFSVQRMYGPFLVVVPLSTMGGWTREFSRWAPQMNLIQHIGDGESRAQCRDFEWFDARGRVLFNACLTTYDYVLKDVEAFGGVRWQFLVVDEAHRLKNDKSQAYEKLSSLGIANKLLITGTPIQNSVEEMLALMRFLNPATFSDLSGFDLTSGETAAVSEKIQVLRARLSGYVLRRVKREVATELPPKTELIIRVPLSREQRDLSQAIVQRNWAALTRMRSDKGSLQNIAMELRKASNHPFLLQEDAAVLDRDTFLARAVAESGKMYVLDQLLGKLRAEGKRLLLFSQSLGILDIVERYLQIKRLPYQRLDGSTPSDERRRRIDHYNEPGSADFVFMLSTRAGGLGINLETADTVIIFDSDWNPQNDLQAMARAHRIGQKKEVRVYRLVSANSIDEKIIERAKQKMVLEYAIMSMDTSGRTQLGREAAKRRRELDRNTSSVRDLEALLKFGVQELFASSSNGVAGEDGAEPAALNPTPAENLGQLDINELIEKAEQAAAEDSDTELAANDPEAEFKRQFEIMDLADKLQWDAVVPEAQRALLDADADREADQARRAALSEDLGIRRAKYAFLGEMSAAAASAASVDAAGAGDGAAPGSSSPAGPSRRRPARSSGLPTTRPSASTGPPDELSVTDVKALLKALLKYGASPQRRAAVVSDAGLDAKTTAAVDEAVQGLLANAKIAVASATGSEANPTMEFAGVERINAAQLLSRVDDLARLDEVLGSQSDATRFRLAVALKAVRDWRTPWGVREDAMLLVGVFRHGHGSWAAIEADAELGLAGKLNLDGSVVDERSRPVPPRSVHLQRRCDYLFKQLPGAPSSSSGATASNSQPSSTAAATPKTAPKTASKATPKTTGKPAPESDELDEAARMSCKRWFQPKKLALKALRNPLGETPHERAQHTLKHLLDVGAFVDSLLQARAGRPATERERFERDCWRFVALFWPNRPIQSAKIREFYRKKAQQRRAGS